MIKRKFVCKDWTKHTCGGKPCKCTIKYQAEGEDEPSMCLFAVEGKVVQWEEIKEGDVIDLTELSRIIDALEASKAEGLEVIVQDFGQFIETNIDGIEIISTYQVGEIKEWLEKALQEAYALGQASRQGEVDMLKDIIEHKEVFEESMRAQTLITQGHTHHCACRLVWGDGECECGKGASNE